ncbi:MAG: hypothetical protein FGM40_04020 [Rhodocyclaceae bacterium]|nr:hypothetical protein [Rhodocyclaceae bacterium]
MKYALPTCAVLALLGSAPVMAEEAAAPASPHTFTANVGVFSQYIFRGISQTNEDPALQGGFDYAHASGVYLGTWASNISWLQDGDYYKKGGSAEIDFYGGYKNTLGDTGVGYDVGLLYYWYPGNNNPASLANADTLEAYGALSWKWFTAKYSYSLLDRTFGTRNSDGTWYVDLGAAVPLGDTGLTAGAHWGRQHYEGSGNGIYSYSDWRVSLAYDMGKLGSKFAGSELGVMYTDNTTNTVSGYTPNVYGSREQFTGYIKRTF